MKQSTTTHVVNYVDGIIIVENVPCEECYLWGEKFYSDEVAKTLEKIVESAKSEKRELTILDYTKETDRDRSDYIEDKLV